MFIYIAYRVLGVIPVLLGVSIFIFLLVYFAPGDVTTAMLGQLATEEAREELREQLGLNEPLPVQYVLWLGRVLQGDFGISFASNRDVVDVVVPRYLNTLLLTVVSMTLAMAIAFFVGVFSAAKTYSLFDRVSMSTTLVFGSTPSFWLAMILVFFFSLKLRWLPATGMQSFLGGGGFWDVARHLVLPAIASAAGPAAITARMIRASMQEVLGQNYIRVARAKGVPWRIVVWKLGLRNALPPILTIAGLQLGTLLGGALFAEVVFAWPGIGLGLYDAINARDIPMIQAAVLLVALSFTLVNLSIDIINSYLDPRQRSL